MAKGRIVNCFYCGAETFKTEWALKTNKNSFCSRECLLTHNNEMKSANKVRLQIPCAWCGKITEKQPCYVKLYKNSFCNLSCSTKYNNANKTTGYRRSKLEAWIEEAIKSKYPDLEVFYSDKATIKSELDIYIPLFKLAFEISGPTHYIPLYGEEKLKSIQENDKKKSYLCRDNGIELVVINVSDHTYVTLETSQPYIQKILNIIDIYIATQHCYT